MLTFTHTIETVFPMLGAAGRLEQLASCYPDTLGTLRMGNRIADISRPMKLATMGIRKGDAVTVTVEGPSEVELFDVLCSYFGEAM